jgi:protein-S-isoprenylcysteine O-methyltransferase Ste14
MTSATSSKSFAAFRGFLYSSGFVLLWAWAVAAARPYDSRIPLEIPTWLQAPGFVLACFGAVVDLWCITAFAISGRGTPAPFDAPREFVAVGPYAYVRNPLYLGALAVIAGAGLMLRSPAALGVGLLFITLVHVLVIVYEEPVLERQFGQSYRHYKTAVHRWLPRRPSRDLVPIPPSGTP